MINSTTDRTNSRPRLPRFIRVIGRLLAGLGLLFVIITVTPVDIWWTKVLAGPRQPASGKVLIVLGGTVNDYGTVGGSSYWRCVYAAHYFRDGGFEQIVVSGGQIEGNPVSGAMADFLVCLGVPRAAIRAEARSESTRENAVYTKELLGNDSRPMVLVTSDYHMFRASRCFRKVGLNVAPLPNPDVAMRAQHWRGRWPAFLDLVLESFKIAYYFVRGWI
jgi:uncharacterized SAM-binding protein YcdF (DUF218 family)